MVDGCHNLAEFMEAIKKDNNQAREIFEDNCIKNKFGLSCFKAGLYNTLGRGCKRNKERAHEMFRRGCEEDCYKSCTNAGLMLTSRDKLVQLREDYQEGAKYLEKGCQLGDSISCYHLSLLHMGTFAPLGNNMKKAFEYTKKACEKDHMPACVNLHLMYKRGEGTPKDEVLAEKYKQKIKAFNDTLNDNVQIDFQKGI
ncbi:COA7 [Cordylochernes scorpioides]|uniref:COA7 n=1 Tax=Cordylochernes scorpioides TaxID=51811 RepID=A0ABY6L859_9ARAC|nr:COA7 [Cordylochernes scorpioides]